MPSAEAKFARIRDKLPHFAEVALDLAFSDPPPEVRFDCCGRGFYSQGYIEDVSANGYDDWKAGAREGVLFALRVTDHPAKVTVTRISGLGTDTNPTIVAMAAALAVWRALNVQPPSWAMESLESVVFGSWARGATAVPDLSAKQEPGDAAAT
jgi:hypothetical protein